MRGISNKHMFIVVFSLIALHASSREREPVAASASFSPLSGTEHGVSEDRQKQLIRAYLDTSRDPITSLYSEKTTREAVRDFFVSHTGSRKIADAILFYAEKENLPIGMVFSLVFVESGFRVRTVSRANKNRTKDLGLFQLNTQTFRHFSRDDFFDIETNVQAGTKYLRYAFDLDPNPNIALAIYNAGPSRPLSGRTPDSTKIYVSRILSRLEFLEERFRRYMQKKFLLVEQIDNKHELT